MKKIKNSVYYFNQGPSQSYIILANNNIEMPQIISEAIFFVFIQESNNSRKNRNKLKI